MPSDIEEERDFYRRRCDELSEQLLKAQEAHNRATHAVRRSRSTAALIRRLYRIDQMNMDLESLARTFLETAIEAMTVERGALFRANGKGRGFVTLHALNFSPSPEGILADVDIPGGFRFANSTTEPDDFITALSDVAGAPYFLWAYDPVSGIAVYFGNCQEDAKSQPRFTEDDRELAEAALDVFANVAERKRIERQLVHDAFHDALTGLPNRSLFIEHLDHAMRRAMRAKGYQFSVLFLDLDRFKLVNDSLGHAAGDELLKSLAERLNSSTRPGDVVARLGGDEFAVLADDLREPEDAARLAERIHRALQAPFEIAGQMVFMTTSIGIAKSTESYHDGDELLRDADIAMYSAKELGGASHRLFDADMHAVRVSRLQLETDLRHAIDNGELRVAYQPIFNLKNHRLAGFEALLRWRHPLKGVIRPREFITMAEETGLILPIGRWMVNTVVCQLQLWHQNFPGVDVFVSVNLSDREFVIPEYVQQLDALLREKRVPPGSLEFELTERMLMHYGKLQTDVLTQLREKGIRVSIDDFGTGYSSLSRLQRLPIDKLKIDQSFIRGMECSEENAEMVRTILAMGRNLGMQCVAEGVETEAQLQQLARLGCEYAQGYYLGKPMAAVRATDLVALERT